MSEYPPPTEDLPIFDPNVFRRTLDAPLTIAEGLLYFLAFPIAQGPEEIGDLTIGNSGVCPTMPLVPPDNSLHIANTTWVTQYITGVVTGFAPINSPAFTGIPTAPTAAPSDNSQQLANTSWVRTYATSTFQTLSGMSLYALLASPIFSGTPTTPSPVPLDNSLQIPNTSWVTQYITGVITGFAPINSPAFTGIPTAPTAAPSDNSQQLANTSWVRTYATSTFQTLADMVNYLTIVSAAATYQTLAGMSAYLTIASAAATYQTLAGMSSYLTIASANATFQTLAGMNLYALLASPTFTGIPAAPLPTPANNNTSQIATCVWVNTAISASGGGDAFLAGGTSYAAPQTFTGFDAFSNNITSGGVPVGMGATSNSTNSVLGTSALQGAIVSVTDCVAIGNSALPIEVGSLGTPVYTILTLTRNSGGTQFASPPNTTNTGALIFSGGSPSVVATGTFSVTTGAIISVASVTLTTGGSGYLSAPIVTCDFSQIQPPGCIDILNPAFVPPVITPFMSQTGYINAFGVGNTAVGTLALQTQNGANYNTALGYQAGNNITTGSYNTCIGYNSVVPVATADNQIAIGNQFSNTFIRGQVDFINYPPLSAYTPTLPASLTNKAYVDSVITPSANLVPVGSIIIWGGNTTAPSGYLFCDGASISTIGYSVLFAVIGYTYGGSGGAFNLPNMFSGTGKGTMPTCSSTIANGGVTLAPSVSPVMSGGNQALTTAQLASHSHNITYPSGTNYAQGVNFANNTTTGGASSRATGTNNANLPSPTDTAGSGDDYLPPFVAFTFIIKT